MTTMTSNPNPDSYIAGADADYWRYEVAERGAKVTLKTIGGIQTTGNWTGPYGHSFVGWAPLIKADKAKEELLRQHAWKKPYSQLVAEGFAPAAPTAVKQKRSMHDLSPYDRYVAGALLEQLQELTGMRWQPA